MKKLKNNSGVTLIEILIGILISVIMMGAMFTSYTVVNNSYSQVTDKAAISTAGRDMLGMIIRDIRNAGFQYFGDTIRTTSKLSPILITKDTSYNSCDKIELVSGDVNITYPAGKDPVYEYSRYKITYECKASNIIDKVTGNKIDAFAIYKTREKWSPSKLDWLDTATDSDASTYANQLVTDYIVDLVFIPYDDDGKIISPPPTSTNSTKDYLYKIKTIDIALTVRSKKQFYRKSKPREILALLDPKRNKGKLADKYLRDMIIVTAHARNLGMQ